MTSQTHEAAPAGTVRALLVLLAALLPVLGLLVAAPTATAVDQTPKIAFCHATSSNENPYNLVTSDADSIIKTGHDGHIGPVWTPGLSGSNKDWGDIIPAFDWVDKDGVTQHFTGLNTDRLDVIANNCVVPPIQVELTAPVSVDQTCDAPGTITITAREGVTWTLDGVATAPGTHTVAPGTHTVAATALDGYTIVGPTSWTLTVDAATGCAVVTVTPVNPEVITSGACGVEGSYIIPTTTGVTYLLDGTPVAAGTHSGPAKGTITAQALTGYQLTDPEWSFALDVPAAEACPVVVVVTPVEPTVVQSGTCDAEGSYTIPTTTGVSYLLDGDAVAAGKHDGPAKGTITAVAQSGYQLADPEWSFALDVAAAEACPVIVVATPEDPSVVQSSECNAEGSYTIPTTPGVTYLLDGDEIAAGTYDGPASGTVTAKAQEGYTLSAPNWSFDLSVAAAEVCSLPSTGGTLPQTGSDSAPLAGIAALLLALGAGMVVVGTRRPTTR